MNSNLLKSIWLSLEWRVLAFTITFSFFALSGYQFWEATNRAVLLQLILFVVQVVWIYQRKNLLDMYGKTKWTNKKK